MNNIVYICPLCGYISNVGGICINCGESVLEPMDTTAINTIDNRPRKKLIKLPVLNITSGMAVLITIVVVIILGIGSIWGVYNLVKEYNRGMDVVSETTTTLNELIKNDSNDTEELKRIAEDAVKISTVSPLSRDKLKVELIGLGYDESNIDKALDSCGIDWNRQAVRAAEYYMTKSDFSRKQLINKLVSVEKFTNEEAEYGADNYNREISVENVDSLDNNKAVSDDVLDTYFVISEIVDVLSRSEYGSGKYRVRSLDVRNNNNESIAATKLVYLRIVDIKEDSMVNLIIPLIINGEKVIYKNPNLNESYDTDHKNYWDYIISEVNKQIR